MGQYFPHDDIVHVILEKENARSLTVAFKGMYKDEKMETWEYTILY